MFQHHTSIHLGKSHFSFAPVSMSCEFWSILIVSTCRLHNLKDLQLSRSIESTLGTSFCCSCIVQNSCQPRLSSVSLRRHFQVPFICCSFFVLSLQGVFLKLPFCSWGYEHTFVHRVWWQVHPVSNLPEIVAFITQSSVSLFHQWSLNFTHYTESFSIILGMVDRIVIRLEIYKIIFSVSMFYSNTIHLGWHIFLPLSLRTRSILLIDFRTILRV